MYFYLLHETAMFINSSFKMKQNFFNIYIYRFSKEDEAIFKNELFKKLQANKIINASFAAIYFWKEKNCEYGWCSSNINLKIKKTLF